MMDDITPELLDKIKKEFDQLLKEDKTINEVLGKIAEGTANYHDANAFALSLGDILSKAYGDNLSSNVLPDGKMYYNIAKRIIDPTMRNNYDLISETTLEIQSLLNKQANIGIKAIKPELDQENIDNIINKISAADKYDDVSWMLDAPIQHFSQSIVDETIRANAEFHSKSGMKPKIVRRLAGNCCDWCRALAGIYTYPDVPKDVYRRHNNCRCTVEYHPGDGKVQDVHTKQWKTEEEHIKIEKRKLFASVSPKKYTDRLEVTAQYLNEATPRKGKIIFDDGYKKNNHLQEIEVANIIFNRFGGDIRLVNEVDADYIKNPDYLWNNKYWDLKTVTTEKSADSAIRKGLKQIRNNPGGIILDYRTRDVDHNRLMDVIDNRMRRSNVDSDIMIILDNDIRIYRFKK